VGTYNPQTQLFEGGHYGAYEFHPVVAKVQNYCSEDLGAFYLDVLKDRLYTTQPRSKARLSAQTTLHLITQSMLRWMAPFLSFTAEEAWALVGDTPSIFTQTYQRLPAADAPLVDKWQRIRGIRDEANKAIEALRAQGKIGSSLQAHLALVLNEADHKLLQSLGDDLRFVFITSAVAVQAGTSPSIDVQPSPHAKCARCWHWVPSVGQSAKEPALCDRCISNLHGAGETRTHV
jgi:isoleucyl-tRNA synthetase